METAAFNIDGLGNRWFIGWHNPTQRWNGWA